MTELLQYTSCNGENQTVGKLSRIKLVLFKYETLHKIRIQNSNEFIFSLSTIRYSGTSYCTVSQW